MRSEPTTTISRVVRPQLGEETTPKSEGDHFSKLPIEITESILRYDNGSAGPIIKPRHDVPLVSKRFSPVGTKLLYERIVVNLDNFNLLYRTIVEDRGHHLAILVKRCQISPDDEELPPLEGRLINLIQHLPRIESFTSLNSACNRFWLSYPMTTSPALANLNEIYMEDLDQGSLPLILGSYKLVKRIALYFDSEADDEFGGAESNHIPNQFFKRRELDSVDLACVVLSADIRRFLACVSCVELNLDFSCPGATIGQILEHIDPTRMTSLSLNTMPTTTPITPNTFQDFTHLRRLCLTNILTTSDFLSQIIEVESPLHQLRHITYEHWEVKAIDLTLLIRLSRYSSTKLTIRSIEISTVRASTNFKSDPSQWTLAEWSGVCAREDMVELIRVGKERRITLGGTNVEALEIERRYNEARWSAR